MIAVRKSAERGRANHGWLDSYFTFSFSDYYDPRFMGFRDLRVINEDRIAGGQGFPTHPHNDMEIVTYVISGALEHRDTLGNVTRIQPGEVQRMSAGTGIRHSEFNASADQETHLLQIWILPDKRGHAPSYGQKDFSQALTTQDLILTVSKGGRDGSIAINQDVDLYVARWRERQNRTYSLRQGRGLWVQLISGELDIQGQTLEAGDGVAVSGESEIRLHSRESAEFLLFDLP